MVKCKAEKRCRITNQRENSQPTYSRKTDERKQFPDSWNRRGRWGAARLGRHTSGSDTSPRKLAEWAASGDRAAGPAGQKPGWPTRHGRVSLRGPRQGGFAAAPHNASGSPAGT